MACTGETYLYFSYYDSLNTSIDLTGMAQPNNNINPKKRSLFSETNKLIKNFLLHGGHIFITIFTGALYPNSMFLNNRCMYQSITQQYLKRCLIKDDNNYMFRPIAAIIRFSSESMVVVLYRIGMVTSRDVTIPITSTIISDENLMMAAIDRNM